MKKLLCICLLVAAPLSWVEQKRKFYQIENTVFTVWNIWGGTCSITPYKYWGITASPKEYITGPNVGAISFHLIDDSTFLCLWTKRYRNEHPFEFHLQCHNYISVDIDDRSLEGKHKYEKVEKKYLSKEHSSIYIDIEEKFVRANPKGENSKVLR